MNFKTTGLLLALLIIVGAVWLFYPKAEQPGADEFAPIAQEETEPLLASEPTSRDIVRVTLERPDKPRLVFARAPKPDAPDEMEPWRAVEPLAVPVQGYTVDALVSTFASLRSRSRFAAGAVEGPSAEDAGLAPPVAVVTLVDKSDKQYQIDVGKKVAISNDTYVRVAGTDTIHVCQRDLLSQVKKDFNEYRDKQLLALKPADAVHARIETTDQTYEVSRSADGAWVIDAPVKAHADRDEVLALLRKISALRAREFGDNAPTDLTSYGLDQPYMTVTVVTEAKRALPTEEDESATQPAEPQYETVTETYALAVGGFTDMQHENRHVKPVDQGWIATVAQKDIAGLVPDLVKLRDPRITRVSASSATRIELSADGMTATLDKLDGRWQGAGDLSELEMAAVTDLLEAFEDLRAIDYVAEPEDLAPYGLDDPRAVLTVTAGGAVEPVTLQIGAVTRSARNAYVRRVGQPTIFVVSAAQADRLAVAPLSLRSREIFTGDGANFRRLDVERGATHYSLVRVDKEWSLVEPPDAPVEPAGVRTLVGDLSRLRARRVVGRDDDARFGLDKPAVTVRFALEQPVATPTPPETTQPASAPATELVEHTLRVGRQGTVAYARIDDDPFVFELDETVFRVLTAELINRTLFDFPPEDVVGLTIIAPGGTLEFARQEGQWQFAPDPFVKLSQKKVNDFVAELAKLRVETYLQYRGGDFQATGLFTAPVTVSIRLAGDRLANLKIEQERPGELPRLAGWVEQKCIFRLRPADCEKLLRGLDYYLEAEPADQE